MARVPFRHRRGEQDHVFADHRRLQRAVTLKLPLVVQPRLASGGIEQQQAVIGEHEQRVFAEHLAELRRAIRLGTAGYRPLGLSARGVEGHDPFVARTAGVDDDQ